MKEIYNLKQLVLVRVIGLVEHPYYTYQSYKKRRFWWDRPEGIIYDTGFDSTFLTLEEFHRLADEDLLPGRTGVGKLILTKDKIVCYPPKVELIFNKRIVEKTVYFSTVEQAMEYAEGISAKMEVTLEFN